MRTITVTRYVTPLREGGSMPAVVEGDDLGPVKPVAVIAPLPMAGAGDNDFEDLTRILERVAL